MKKECCCIECQTIMLATAISLPTLPWVKDFLPLLELPNVLVENVKIWTYTYQQTLIKYEKYLHEKSWLTESNEEYNKLMKQVVIESLSELANQLAKEVAVSLERWAYWQFFCDEVSLAMELWELILRHTSRRSNFCGNKITPPPSLVPVLPEIINLVSSEHRHQIKSAIEKVAPPLQYKEIPGTDIVFDEVTMLFKALEQALTMKALRIIAKKVNDSERLEIVQWAQAQAQAMKLKNYSERLFGDKYLKKEIPFPTFKSVL